MLRRLLPALAALLALTAAAAPAHAASLETGMADDRALHANPSAIAAKWAALGVDTVRIHARWSSIAPSPRATVPPRGFHPADPNAPGYDWAALDAVVGAVRANGMRVILAVTGPGPVWASSAPTRHDGGYRPSPAHFRAFSTAVATRYAAQVDRYLIWNEPNQAQWLRPQRSGGKPVSPHVYRALVEAAVPAIHAADPGSTVIMGTLAPSGSDSHSANAPMRPLTFVRSMACVDSRLRSLRTGACRHFRAPAADGFSLHPHGIRLSPDAHSPSRDDAPMGDLPRFTTLLDRLTARHRLRVTGGPSRFPLYLTEFGYQTDPPDRYLGVSPSTQAKWLVRGVQKAYWNPRVRNLTWYVYRDEPLGHANATGWQSGLLYASGKAKPALRAFALPFAATTRSVFGIVRPGAAHRVAIQARSLHGSYRSIRSLSTGRTGAFSGRVRAPSWARYVRARVIDSTAAAGRTSLGVRVR